MKERIIEVMNALTKRKANGFNDKDIIWKTKYGRYVFSPIMSGEGWVFYSGHECLYMDNTNRLDIEIL